MARALAAKPNFRSLHAETAELDSSAYRWHVLQNAVREHEICTAFELLRSAGIQPVLLKGWSVGRLYPDPNTRPLGDIDLLVRDEELARAEEALREYGPLNIDWHRLSSLDDEFADPERVIRRSELVPLGNTEIRVLCHEDNLHFVAIHMLRHGAWSPIWMRDVAVLLASRPAKFDWNICPGPELTRAAWVLSAMVIAHRFAGADICGTPAEVYEIPEWLERAVQEAQKTPDPADNQPPESIWTALAHPWRIRHAIRERWPNPITAAIKTGAAFEARSPFVHQLCYCANLVGKFVSRAF